MCLFVSARKIIYTDTFKRKKVPADLKSQRLLVK